MKTQINIKKILLFILFFVIGGIAFLAPTVIPFFNEEFYTSLLLPVLFVVYVVLLVSILKNYSHKKLIVIFLLIIVHLLLMAIRFPDCKIGSSWGAASSKNCTCIGIEKSEWLVMDLTHTQCMGIPINNK